MVQSFTNCGDGAVEFLGAQLDGPGSRAKLRLESEGALSLLCTFPMQDQWYQRGYPRLL